jgi:molecular chaperone Hsp33
VLTVTKYLEGAKQPFSGQVALEHGRIARDLAHYFLLSEQIPTAFNLSVYFNSEGASTGAGGLFLQALPGADDGLMAALERQVQSMPSIGVAMAEHHDPVQLIEKEFKNFAPRFLEDYRIEFFCRCSREKVRSNLKLLTIEDLKDIQGKGPFPLEVRCQNCNTAYGFERKDIDDLLQERLRENTAG